MEIISVTNRLICKDFLGQVEKIAKSEPKFIILREKDLPEEVFLSLAKEVKSVCNIYNVPLVINSFYRVAEEIEAEGIHLPLELAEKGEYKSFKYFGISTHSLSDAIEAESLGATYITYGHIFATDCKKGLAPRGTKELKEICSALNIPVYGIGGITPQNAIEAVHAGAKGICLMSSLMRAEEPRVLINEVKRFFETMI